MNVPYELWPIWCDYLEEQGFETELLRYIMTYSLFVNGVYADNHQMGIGTNYYNYYEIGDGYLYFNYAKDWDIFNSIAYGNALTFSIYIDHETFNLNMFDYDSGCFHPLML